MNIVWITNERSLLLSAGFESRVYRGKDVNSTEVGISRGRHRALLSNITKKYIYFVCLGEGATFNPLRNPTESSTLLTVLG